MRIITEDPVLGVSKVTWKFFTAPEPGVEPHGAGTEAAAPEEVSGTRVQERPAPGVEAAREIPEETAEELPLEAAEQIPEEAAEKGPRSPSGASVDPVSLMQFQMNDLRTQVSFLQRMCEDQSAQLRTKDELLRNFQVLLKTEQERVLQLEERLLSESEAEPVRPGFWSRWFR